MDEMTVEEARAAVADVKAEIEEDAEWERDQAANCKVESYQGEANGFRERAALRDRHALALRTLLAALDRERAARERAEQRAGELEEACQAALGNLDHLTDVWGQEGITRTVQDKLRAAVGPPRRAEFIPYFNVLPAAARPGSGEGE